MEKNEFLDKIAAGKMTRREFKKALAAAGLAMFSMPLVQRSAMADAEDHPTIFMFAGYDDENFHQRAGSTRSMVSLIMINTFFRVWQQRPVMAQSRHSRSPHRMSAFGRIADIIWGGALRLLMTHNGLCGA